MSNVITIAPGACEYTHTYHLHHHYRHIFLDLIAADSKHCDG